jgi:hypothetical protein
VDGLRKEQEWVEGHRMEDPDKVNDILDRRRRDLKMMQQLLPLLRDDEKRGHWTGQSRNGKSS